MTNLEKISIEKLLNLDNGLTTLFYMAMAGMDEGGLDIDRSDARQLTDVLSHQMAIQKVLYQKVKNLVEPIEFDNDRYFDEDTK